MADQEDVLRAAGLDSDESDDEPVLERPTARSVEPDAAEPSASDQQGAGRASAGSPARDGRAETLRAAGLDDSDADAPAGSAGRSPHGSQGPDHLDDFEQAGAPVIEELRPGAVQRMTGPPEVRPLLRAQASRALRSVSVCRAACAQAAMLAPPLATAAAARAQVWELPVVQRPRGAVLLATFKSILDIEAEPFNRERFTLEDEAAVDESGARVARAPALNRLRWRFTDTLDPETQSLERESNARFVRWEDGSLSLFVGEECVDVVEAAVQGQQVLLGVYHEGAQTVQARFPSPLPLRGSLLAQTVLPPPGEARWSSDRPYLHPGPPMRRSAASILYTLMSSRRARTSALPAHRVRKRALSWGARPDRGAWLQAQTLIRSKLAFRPPDANSQLARNAARTASPGKAARDGIKGSFVLKDFRQEHLEAVDREQEALKITCVPFAGCAARTMLTIIGASRGRACAGASRRRRAAGGTGRCWGGGRRRGASRRRSWRRTTMSMTSARSPWTPPPRCARLKLS